MKRVLITGGSFFQIPLVLKAKELGCRVGIVDINPDAPARPHADENFVASLRDADAVVDAARRFGPDGIVLGACDVGVVAAAHACQELGLPGNSVETAIVSTDKVKMLGAFAAHGVPCPAHQVVPAGDVGDFDMRVPYPAISKPTDSSAGRGVHLIEGPDDLMDAVRFSSSAGASGDVLIEEYMDGPEVSVEMLVVNSEPHALQVTDKLTSGPPSFFEIGDVQPSGLPDPVKDGIRELAGRAVQAVGVDNGPAHVEVKVTGEGAKMVELGARLGGDFITSYLIDTSVVGINLMEASIRLALGERPDVSRYADSGDFAAVRFLAADSPGVIREAGGLERARNVPGIVDVGLMKAVGETFPAATDNSGRLGYAIARGRTALQAVESCETAIRMIRIG